MTASFELLPSYLQAKSPIIVRIVQPERNEWRDLLVSALGVIAVLVLIAVVAAMIIGGVMFWIRSRSA